MGRASGKRGESTWVIGSLETGLQTVRLAPDRPGRDAYAAPSAGEIWVKIVLPLDQLVTGLA